MARIRSNSGLRPRLALSLRVDPVKKGPSARITYSGFTETRNKNKSAKTGVFQRNPNHGVPVGVKRRGGGSARARAVKIKLLAQGTRFEM